MVFLGFSLFDNRTYKYLNLIKQSSLLIIKIQTKFYSIKTDFHKEVNGIFLPPHPQLSIISIEEIDNYNVYTKFNYSKSVQNLQTTKNLTFKINNNPTKPSVIAHFCNNTLYIYPLTETIKHYTNTRCNLAPLIETIKIETELSVPPFSLDTSKCPCLSFNKESFNATKSEPIGISNVNNNLELLLKSLGVYTTFKEVLTFCSAASFVSFDIGK